MIPAPKHVEPPSIEPPPTEFERVAEQGSPGLLREIGGFLSENKKWWLIPIVVALVLVGGLVLLGGTAVAPFIYTLF